ncbi:hypothetical protein BN77_p10891 [Rhizobium mesoamericanum STM3625]|uniref:Uncharacterized protein n=1 Tax=Rhizobium mesoamericanum STM3625 TaxID=1211777 RepID=K0PNW0_9HYPH|nr:hypothetical protein BN77_p10891 [Rhizobium mesoamericanum STM3625]
MPELVSPSRAITPTGGTGGSNKRIDRGAKLRDRKLDEAVESVNLFPSAKSARHQAR